RLLPFPTRRSSDLGLVPLVGPVGDVQEQVFVDELLPDLGVPFRALVGEVDDHRVTRHRVRPTTRLPDTAGGGPRITVVGEDVGVRGGSPQSTGSVGATGPGLLNITV